MIGISVPPKGDYERRVDAFFAPLSARAQDVPNLSVRVSAGSYYTAAGEHAEFGGGNSPSFTPPTTAAAWRVLVLNESGTLQVVNGTAGSSPVLPTLPDKVLPICAVFMNNGAAAITNDMVFDIRPLWQTKEQGVPNVQDQLDDRYTKSETNNLLDGKADVDGTPNLAFVMNKDQVGVPGSNVLFEVERGASSNVAIRWNEASDLWELTNDGTTYNPIGTVGGTFMPTVPGAMDGNVAVFASGNVADGAIALADLTTDAELTAGLAGKADQTAFDSHVLNTGIHFTLPITQADVTDLISDLDDKADITGDTFTGDITVQVAGNQPVALSSRDTGSSGLLIARSGDPDAILEFDESTDQWIAGVLGLAFPILTANNLELKDLQDVSDPLTTVATMNDVLRYNGVEWTNDPLNDKVNVNGDTLTGALILAPGAAGAPSLTFTSDITKGFYDSGVGEFSMAIGGLQKVKVDATGLTTYSGFAQGSAPGGVALWNTSDPTTGIVFPSPGVMDIIVGGTPVASFGGPPGPTTGLVSGDIGVTVQAWDADLDTFAALATDGIARRVGGTWTSVVTLDAADIGSGTFADARVAESNVTQHEAAIDHDALTNFVAAEHIDWSVTGAEDVHVDRITSAAVTQHEGDITITQSQISDLAHTDAYTKLESDGTAGSAGAKINKVSGGTVGNLVTLTAGGELADASVAPSAFALSSHTHAAGDITSGTFADALVASSNVTQHEGDIDHDALTGFVAAEHIDWSVTGAEDVHVDRITSGAVTQHEGDIDHDALTGFVAAEHIDWSVTGAEDVHVDRITSAAVTQHEGDIDHDALTGFVAAEHIDWSVTGAEDVHVDRIAAGAVTQHEAALTITESQISDLAHVDAYTKTESDGTAGSAGAKIDKVSGASAGDVATMTAAGEVSSSGTQLSALAPLASPTFTGVPVVPTYTLGTLPAQGAGGLIFVSDATGSGVTGSLCFSNGTSWIDVTTGIAVV